MRKKGSVLLVVLLLCSLALTGCLSVKGLGKRNLSISGTVLDKEGNPVRGAQIIVASRLVTTAEADGKWSFSNAHKGDVVEVFKDGLKFILEQNEVKADGQKFIFTGTPVPPIEYEISGRVVDNAGRGIPSVTITIAGEKSLTAITNAQGEFKRTVISGTVRVSASKDGYSFTGPETVNGPDQEVVLIGTEETPSEYAISGRVVDSKDNPISDAVILLKDSQDQVINTTTSDSNGFFSIFNLVGEYAMTISKEGWEFTPKSHHVDRTATNINFYGTPDIDATYAISGRILIDGDPSDGSGLPAVNIEIEFLDYSGEVKYSITDSKGDWHMDGLVGAAKITPSKDGYSFKPDHQIVDKAFTTIGFTAKKD